TAGLYSNPTTGLISPPGVPAASRSNSSLELEMDLHRGFPVAFEQHVDRSGETAATGMNLDDPLDDLLVQLEKLVGRNAFRNRHPEHRGVLGPVDLKSRHQWTRLSLAHGTLLPREPGVARRITALSAPR